MKKMLSAVSLPVLMLASQAYAAVPTDATAALDTAKADVGTIGWAVFAVIVAAVAFKYMRRAL